MFYTDLVNITNITINPVTGRTTKVTLNNIKCRVESEDLQKKSADGNLVLYQKLFIFPPRTNLSKGDELQITKIAGEGVTEPVCIAELVYKAARFSPHHMEVYCK